MDIVKLLLLKKVTYLPESYHPLGMVAFSRSVRYVHASLLSESCGAEVLGWGE